MKRICILGSLLLSVSLFAQKPVRITGVFGDSIRNANIGYYDYPFLETNFNPLRGEGILKEGNVCDEIRFFPACRAVLLGALKQDSNGYSQQSIFITPGDSVSFVIDIVDGRPVFKFSGSNAAHYNFDYLLAEKCGYFPPFRKGDDVTAYKKNLGDIVKTQYAFLDDYIAGNSVSTAFCDYAKARILNEYLWRLSFPFINYGEKAAIPDGYLDKNLRPVNEWARYYPDNVLNFYFDYYRKENWNDPDSLYRAVKAKFSGREQEYMVSALIGMYANKQNPEYQSQLSVIVREARQTVKDSVYLDYIETAYQYYALLKNPFPEPVSSNTFFREYGQSGKISLATLLERYKGKPVFIDFWASWCGPCIGDIERSAEAKAYLKEKGVEYIYVAIKEKQDKNWEEAVKRLHIEGNQFLLLDSYNSPLVDYLRVYSIPQYMLLDTNHKIVDAKAPKPIPELLNQLKECIDKCFKKTVTFY